MFGQPFYSRHVLHWPIWRIALVQMIVGLLSVVGSLMGGRNVQHIGAKRTMLIGYTGLCVGAVSGLTAPQGWNVFLAVVFTALFQGSVFTSVQSSLSRGENSQRTQKYVSAFNISWSSASSVGFFVITPLIGLCGSSALFIIPMICIAINTLFTLLYIARIEKIPDLPKQVTDSQGVDISEGKRAIFRHIGWIANPTAYLLINVINPCNPLIAKQLGLSFTTSSSWLSVWFFTRMITFLVFSRIKSWQFRVEAMFGSYITMAIAVIGMFTTHQLAVQVLCQLMFGASVAMIIQMSLFYSLVGSKTKGRHAGIHEGVVAAGSAVGAGIAASGDLLSSGHLSITLAITCVVLFINASAITTLTGQLRHLRKIPAVSNS